MRDSLFLLKELVRRDQQSRYAGSALGFLWALAQPLWQLLLFTLVFSVLIRIPLDQEPSTDRFAVFIFSGLIPWMAFNEGLTRATTAITDNAALVKKLSFPSEVLVLAVVIGALVQSVIAIGVFLPVLAFLGEASWSTLPLLVVPAAPLLALTLGLGFLLAALHVFFRDIGQLVTMALQAWFYFTPIVYPLSYVATSERFPKLAEWLALNPLTAICTGYRSALLGAPLQLSSGYIVLLGGCLLVLVAGWSVFRRLRPAFPDEV
ncbi:MAG: ABC transporter permease [Acidobacteriota bacterium]